VQASDGRVLELVVFKLDEGVSRAEFLATNDAVSAWISRQPGFVSRDLSYDADGDRWVDVLWWETMEAARTAAELAMTSEACAPMFSLIDMESTLMVHAERAIDPVYAASTAAA
jgi:hypothetical protein